MTERLSRLIGLAREATMTPDEAEEQRLSFAYGNLAIENHRITRDDVAKASKRLRTLSAPEAP